MEDFVTLVKQGVIYDGCPIIAKGTVRINGNDITIESMHNTMAVDGKSFAELCEPGTRRTEQGQLLNNDLEALESWRSKAEKLEQETEDLSNKLKSKDSLVNDLQVELNKVSGILSEKESNTEALLREKENFLEMKLGQAESLQSKLDSTLSLLEEKEGKMQSLLRALSDRSEAANLAQLAAQEYKDHISLLESEKMEEKKSSAVLLDEFSQWRTTAEEEMANLKKELEMRKHVIETFKTELEIAEVEGTEYQASLSNLQKENQALRSQLNLTDKPVTADPERVSLRRQKSQQLKNLLKSVSTNLKGDKEKDETKRERKESMKRSSVASNPTL